MDGAQGPLSLSDKLDILSDLIMAYQIHQYPNPLVALLMLLTKLYPTQSD